jgi:putative transposase
VPQCTTLIRPLRRVHLVENIESALLKQAHHLKQAVRELISTVTDAVLEEVSRWQSRPLDPLYALVFFDALRVKMRDEGTVRNKAVYLAIGVTPEGRKDVLGIWIEQTEGAKSWLRAMTEIKNRGAHDILIAIIDGLKDFRKRLTQCFLRRRSRPASCI